MTEAAAQQHATVAAVEALAAAGEAAVEAAVSAAVEATSWAVAAAEVMRMVATPRRGSRQAALSQPAGRTRGRAFGRRRAPPPAWRGVACPRTPPRPTSASPPRTTLSWGRSRLLRPRSVACGLVSAQAKSSSNVLRSPRMVVAPFGLQVHSVRRGLGRPDGGFGRRGRAMYVMGCKECARLHAKFGFPPFTAPRSPALLEDGRWAPLSNRTWKKRYSAMWDM